MELIKYLSPSVWLVILTSFCSAQPPSVFTWPKQKIAAVSVTFDDGRPGQVEFAIPILEKFQIKATFFLNAIREGLLSGWQIASAKGHEIANHTLKHPCSGKLTWVKYPIEDYSLTTMRTNLINLNDILENAVGVRPVSFAYPCGHTAVGAGDSLESFVPIVEELFTSGRTTERGLNNPLDLNFSTLKTIGMDQQTFAEVKIKIDLAIAQGKWILLFAHDVGEPASQTMSSVEFALLCKYLADPANDLWVAPVKDVVQHIKSKQNSSANSPFYKHKPNAVKSRVGQKER